MGPGEALGKYRLDALIGRGGGGDVFRAEQGGIGGFSRPVAVKILHDAVEVTGDSVDKLAREARIIGRLQHRNIVQVHELAEARGIYFLVMELVDGVTLKGLIRAFASKLPLWLGIHVGVEICHALSFAHQAADEQGRLLGIVHRDIKPSNVLLSQQGDVKLSDFGLAKASALKADHLTAHGIVKGTPAYMAPEQRAGAAVTAAADVFALAMMVCEACLGERPAAGRSARGKPPPALTALDPAVPPVLDEVLGAALAVKPKRRPSADEVGQVLERTLSALLPPEKLSRLNEETAVWVRRTLDGVRSVPSKDGPRAAASARRAPPAAPAIPAAKALASPGTTLEGIKRRGASGPAAAPPVPPSPGGPPPLPAVSTALPTEVQPEVPPAGAAADDLPRGAPPSPDPVRPPGLEAMAPERIAHYAALVEDEEVDVTRGAGAVSSAPDLSYADRAQQTHRRVFVLVILGVVAVAVLLLWQEFASDWVGDLSGRDASQVQPAKPAETGETGEAGEASETSETAETGDTDETDETDETDG